MPCPQNSLCCRPSPSSSSNPSTSSHHHRNLLHYSHHHPEMPPPRHLYLFYRADGKCILHKPYLEDPTPPQSPPPSPPLLSPSSLWPLLQVFIQFARELQRGNVKRLVFRHPHLYTPPLHRFQPMPHSAHKPHSDLPIVVHIAHDDLFVIAVIEQVPASQSLDLLTMAPADLDQSPVFTIGDFCGSLLDFLNKEQTSFLATLTNDDFNAPTQTQLQPREQDNENYDTSQSTLLSSSRLTRTTCSSDSQTTVSDRDLFQSPHEENPSTAISAQPMVDINESRISEFISKTQSLMRM